MQEMLYKMWIVPFRGVKVRIVNTTTGFVHSKHSTIREAREQMRRLNNVRG
jgi:hypothetical protein